ncbi:MAG: clan AA aspartic protease [Halobacteriota archaeon]
MKGYIDEYGQGRVRVEVMVRKMEMVVDAVIDTGFDEYLCLPVQIAIQLGLELSDTMEVELADGTIKKEMVFSGSAKFGEETRDVEITLTESRDALIGTRMFSYLEIDFEGKRVRIK